MRPYEVFASRFGNQISFNKELIVEKNQRFYLFNPRLKKDVQYDFYYAGLYLGKIGKNGGFFPSFNLLNMLVDAVANKIVIDQKASWLFICGRDVMRKSIIRVQGPGKKDTNTLVFNECGECLGFGRIVEKLRDSANNNVISVRNVLDIGDFLRRER